MDRLDLVPTIELVEELFSRSTFAGVLIYSPTEHKFSGQKHDGFTLKATTDAQACMTMLANGLDAMKNCVRDCGE